MSKMKTDCKPPLAKSPTRLRPRRVLESNANCMQTPAGGSLRKPEKARRSDAWKMEEAELRPEFQSMKWEMRALAKMVGDEQGKEDLAHSRRGAGGLGGIFSMSTNSSPLFERGRFYEEYSARRNERLNRKNKGCEANSTTAAPASATKYNKYNDKLGVTVESAKRSTCTRSTISGSRKLQSLRKSVSAAYSYSVETPTPAPAPPPTITPSPTPRYMLRSLTNKENQKPPLPQALHSYKSVIRGGRKIGAPRVGY